MENLHMRQLLEEACRSVIGESQRREAQEPSLRDRFAMAALQGMLARGQDAGSTCEAFALGAYEYADAMLAVRSAKPEASR